MRFDTKLLIQKTHSKWSLWALLIVPVLLFFTSVIILAPDAPWWDEYDSTIGYLSYSAPERFLHLLDFHNEHRLLFPRLVFELLNCFPGRFSFLACILLGDCILVGYVALWCYIYSQRFKLLFCVPFVWLFLDLANCENTLWGLTAIQSHAVLFFALSSTLAFTHRASSRIWLIVSLVLALLSTASSASGLGIWPALLITELIATKPKREKFQDVLIIGCISTIVIGLYLHGFFAATSSHTAGHIWSLPKSIDFLLCFLGNIVPIAVVARILGVCSLLASGIILFNWKRLANDPIFSFFLYLQSITASGLLVRSCMEGAGLYYRLEIIAISIFCAETYLLLRLCSGTKVFSVMSKALLFCIPLAIAANLLALCFGYSFLLERKHEIENGYHAWPRIRTLLPAADVTSANKILQQYVDRIEKKTK